MIGTEQRASRRSLRAIDLRDWALIAPDAVDSADRLLWGNRIGRTELVQPTGSQTEVETLGELTVSSIASISANDLACRLWPATIATGQKWRCKIRLKATSQDFLMAALVFTDGTLTTSNLVSAFAYINNGVDQYNGANAHGTVTNVATLTGDSTISGVPSLDSVHVFELEYTSANTFAARFFRYGDHGLFTSLLAITGTAKTMTPTHVGVGWSNWGDTPTAPVVTFGPVYRAA